jgi:hypothetical protein
MIRRSLLGCGRVAVWGCAAGVWPEDHKQRDRGDDDAGDDKEHQRAGESWPLFRWWCGRFHDWFDAKFGIRRSVFFWRGESVFLQGFLGESGAKLSFLDGENVVECVVNVVNKLHQNHPAKNTPRFSDLFS